MKTGQNWPFTIIERNGSRSVEISGFIAEMWNILKQHLNINTSCTSPEGITDAEFEGHFEREKVDIGLTGVIGSSLTKIISSLTTKLGTTSIFLVTRRPGPQSIQWSGFLRPFSVPLWLTLVAAVALLLAALWTLCRVDPQPDALFTLIAAFLQQATGRPARRGWLRVLLVSAHLTTVVLWAGYSASLVSCLAGFDDWTIADYWTMADSGRYNLHLVSRVKETDMLIDFQRGPAGKSLNVGIKGFISKMHESYEDALAAVCRDDRGVALVRRERAGRVLRISPCPLVEVPRSQLRVDVGILMKKNSPYLRLVNYYINKMRHSGLHARRIRLQLGDRPEASAVQYESVAFQNVSALLCLYLTAIGASLLLLQLERCLFVRYRRRRLAARPFRPPFK